MIPTPHIEANDKEQIAKSILLPGDPLRAKFIADNFLENVKTFNTVRNAFGYTGTYMGKKVSVMGSGMGMPSIGIYSYELIHFYGVKNLIRVGSCGAYLKELKLHDIIIAMGASTNSNFANQYNLPGSFSAIASYDLLKKATDYCDKNNIAANVGNILSSDIFYNDDQDAWKRWAKMGILAVEMESYALYANAARAGANALCILTVSDNLVTHEETTSKEREQSFTQMMEIALDIC